MQRERATLLQGTLDPVDLEALATGEWHGLGGSRRIEQITRGTFAVQPGSFFRLASPRRTGWLLRRLRVPLTSRVVNLWRNVVQRRRVERDLDDELGTAFDLLVDEKIAAGMRPEDARRAATLEMGRVQVVKEHVRDARAGAALDALFQDIGYALRLFRRAPGFTIVAVVMLALGIGANAAIFGVLKSVLFDALPYADADHLVHVYGPLSAGTVDEVRQRQRSFESIAAFVPFVDDAVYGSEDGPRSVKIAWVEPGLFHTLGVSPALGRSFKDDEVASGLVPLSGGLLSPDTARAVLVTHAAWKRLFAGSPGVFERDARINGM